MDMLNINTLFITQEILSLITKIDEFKGAWRAFGTLAPEPPKIHPLLYQIK
mgnify:CR=1 FL=1